MADVFVRQVKNTDVYEKIAECVYLTDPFIYPAAFGPDVLQASCAISRLMTIENGLFSPKNMALAFHNEELCGILLYNRGSVQWDRSACAEAVREIVPNMENFHYVSEVYFSVESETPAAGHIEIVACCVLPGFRNMGVGRALLDWLIREYPESIFTLDVLANNPAAIRLYEKCGFEIKEEFKGFSMTEDTRPDCYHMVRDQRQ